MVSRSGVRSLVLTGHGINCEMEMAHGFRLAGAEANVAHLADVLDGRVNLHDYHVLALPGGFSFGDHLGSGKALANLMRHSPFWSELLRFIADGKYVWGVCNGFQALVQLGLLPAVAGWGTREATLTGNDSGRFEDRWVRLRPDPASACIFTAGLNSLYLPCRHGEGKLVLADGLLSSLHAAHQVPLQYADEAGAPTEQFPDNPNGSPAGAAALCDATGRIFGLMPHPEGFLDLTTHPHWTRIKSESRRAGRPLSWEGQGLALFRNVVAHAAAAFCEPLPAGSPSGAST